MKKKLESLSNKPFVRNVIILSSGTAGAQFINMLLSPIITRLYGPEAYGLMGTFIAITSIIIPIAALTYPIAIVLPKSNIEAKALIKLSLTTTTILSISAGIILLLFHKKVVSILQLEEISSFLYLLPLVILSAGVLQVFEQWLIRTKQFSVSAKAMFFHSLILNGSKVGVGFFYPFASILILFTALSSGLKALLLFLFTNKSRKKKVSTNTINKKEKISITAIAKKYKDFPLFRAPEVSINALSQSLPILLLTSLFGPASAGFYSIGRTVLRIPTVLIGKSVADVFYPRISEAANKGENLTKLIKKATLALVIVGIVPYGLVILFGPWLFSFVFGEEWVTAGEYARWIAFWSFCGFINRPSVSSLPVLNAQSFQLIYTIFMLIIRVIVFIFGYYVFSSDVITIAIFGVSGAILNVGLIVITLQISKRYVKNYKR